MNKGQDERKIIVRFKGGLANQIYQLAAGVYLSNLLSHRLYFSDTYYRYKDNPRYLVAPSVYDGSIRRAKDNALIALFQRLLRKTPYLLSRSGAGSSFGSYLFVEDKGFRSLLELTGSDKRELELYKKRNIILDGYFHVSSSLEKSGVLERLGIFRSETTSGIAAHIRLGDYLKKPYSDFYWTISEDYIARAHNSLVLRGADPNAPISIFSDSPDIAAALVRRAIPYADIVTVPSASALSDLRMLASYEYKLLSNSSFSLLSWHMSREGHAVIPSEWFKQIKTDPSQFPPSERLIKIPIRQDTAGRSHREQGQTGTI